MLHNFIYSKTKALFEEKLNATEVPDKAIVFIEDTKEIWNHGTYFAGNNGIDFSQQIQSDWAELDSSTASFIKNKPEIPTADTVESWGFTKNTGNYSMPEGGIPKNDLTEEVRLSLAKADTALQEHQDISHLENQIYVLSTEGSTSSEEYMATGELTVEEFEKIKNAKSICVLQTDQQTDQQIYSYFTYLNYDKIAQNDAIITAHCPVPSDGSEMRYYKLEIVKENDTVLYGFSTEMINLQVSEGSISELGFTKNEGTITEITMNGESKGTSGNVDLGNVLVEPNIYGLCGYQTFLGQLTEENTTFNTASASKNVLITIWYNGHAEYKEFAVEDSYTYVAYGPPFTISYNIYSAGGQVVLDAPNGLNSRIVIYAYSNDYIPTSIAKKSDLDAKQDTISDLETIREGATLGSTAVQPASLATVATSGSYDDLSNKPTIPTEVTESTVADWGFTKNTGTYNKPDAGIPQADLDDTIKTLLEKADTAIQEETDPVFAASVAAEITSDDIANWNNKTDNIGTVTGIKINNENKTVENGIVDLGTVITEHQDISGKQDTISLIEVLSSNLTIDPNKYYRLTSVQEGLQITLNTPSDVTIKNEYFIEFPYTSGSVSFPADIIWENGEMPTFEAGKIYQVSVLNNLAVYAVFDGSVGIAES